MLIRALIVLLIVLNLGVAAWWLTRPEPQPPALPELPAGVARLQLVEEAAPATAAASPGAAGSAEAADTGAGTAAAPPAEPAQCFSLGPFTSRNAASRAQAALQARLARAALREVPAPGASGYQVIVPPLPGREEAQALAQRIGAAGFDDFLVINQGEQANGIALGRYRSREAALRRQDALRSAGFDVQLQPVGPAGPSQWWLDAGVAEGVAPADLARTASTGSPLPLECTALR